VRGFYTAESKTPTTKTAEAMAANGTLGQKKGGSAFAEPPKGVSSLDHRVNLTPIRMVRLA